MQFLSKFRQFQFPIALKLGLAISLLLITGMASITLYIISNQSELLRQQTREMGSTLVQQIAESSAEPMLLDDRLALSTLLKNLTTSPYLLGAAVYDKNQQMLQSVGLVPSGLQLVGQDGVLESGRSVWSFGWTDQGMSDWQSSLISFVKPINFNDVTIGFALITYSHYNLGMITEHATRSLAGVTFAFILLGLVAAIIMGRSISRPVHQLVAATKEIADGNFAYRIRAERFDEFGELVDGFNSMAQGLENKLKVEQLLSQYVSPRVATHLLGNLEHVDLSGTKVNATVLFADMIGFTDVSEKLTPEEVAQLLNEYFSHITSISSRFGGYIDKFIGDCAMVVFGVPEPDPDHSYRAISCALAIQQMIDGLNRRREQKGQSPMYFKIGVNSGEMLAGNMGSEERLQYTVVGDAVNLAARLTFKASANEIIISEDLYRSDALRGRVIAKAHREYQIRGKINPVHGYKVICTEPNQMQYIKGLIRDQLRAKSLS